MSVVIAIVLALVGFAVGFGAAASVARRKERERLEAAEAEAKRLLSAAKLEAESVRRDAEVSAKEAALKAQGDVERELKERRAEVARRDAELSERERAAGQRGQETARRDEELGRRERSLGSREQALEAQARQAEEHLNEARVRLEKVAGLTADEARARLAEQVAADARKAAAGEVKRIEDEARAEAEQKAKTILGAAIQRYAGEYVAERTVSVVALPSDDMKGRIIGREGRNIRALEAATGIDLIIDDTPEAVVISCFNPLRREIARLALTRLIADGRIHPTRIEEVVQKCEAEIEQQCKEAGEQAVFDLGLAKVHPELMRALGRLKFRSSYAQNLLQHSVEVGFIAGTIAGELGLNVKIARRAGLLHDVGKGVDQESEGSHAEVGSQLAKKHGESPKVVQAIAAHHATEGGAAAESLLDHIVEAANTLSSERPGARRETLQSYITRLDQLEKLCTGREGVERAYAIQMGREVRVMVENSRISDEQAVLLSRELARQIEDQLAFAGQIRVCVIRETRSTEYAR